MDNVPNLFASAVFSDEIMRQRMPEEYYKALQNTIKSGRHLELDVANVVANAMKEWAIEKGATHFTHWFQPMTGITAEKHDSFIADNKKGGVIMEFSGKELVKGEPDASSFPSGGLRATFEARGYTAWDPTSYAFYKDGSLYIPTAFCSYSGEALDKKTPLLRSMQALDKEALKLLRVLGDKDTKRVLTTVGPEQEYFLIDKEMFEKRPDLVNTGRTLLGAKPPKGQELEDHYFGSIPKRVAEFMRELDEKLWSYGIMAKTKHNEVAPAQHELAPIFCTTNIASDHNQLTMETMKSLAYKHNMVCLLHEKPFAGVNGSGKHNNWSMSTDKGVNLLEPGKSPAHNKRFLVFLTAIIKAVDEYQDLLRISVASAGNDHRLGANEAPPAILSIFLGEELENILNAFVSGGEAQNAESLMMEIGAKVLPHIPKDTTDRNRTSPFAFTGNKFEFRMLGSANSIAGANIVLNTITAKVLEEFYEGLKDSENLDDAITNLIKTTVIKHRRIIFNGNNYSEEWVAEAKNRGLFNLKSTVEALPYFISQKNVDLFVSKGVLCKSEIYSRYEIMLENYIKTINIEALTMVGMVKKEVLFACEKYQGILLDIALKKEKLKVENGETKDKLNKICELTDSIAKKTEELEDAIVCINSHTKLYDKALYVQSGVLRLMQGLRIEVDETETYFSEELWPFPSYSKILNSVK